MNTLFIGASSEIAKKSLKNLNFNIYGISTKKIQKGYKKVFVIKQYNVLEIQKVIKKIDIKFSNIFIFNGKYEISLLRNLNIKKFNSILNSNFSIPIIIINKLIENNLVHHNATINFISSIAALNHEIGNAYYSISKNIVNFSIKILQKEYKRKKIRFNSISLGFVKTKFSDNILEQYTEIQKKEILLKQNSKFIPINKITNLMKKIILDKKFNGKNIILK